MRHRTTSPLILLASLAILSTERSQAEPGELRASDAPPALNISVELTVGGDLIRDEAEAAKSRVPIEVRADAKYRQAARETNTATARRWYERGTLAVRGKTTAELNDSSETFVAELEGDTLRCGSTERSLTRSEINLIELPADPLTIGALLPTKAVEIGDEWPLEARVLGPLLNLERVSLCDATAVLTDRSERHARFRFAGTVHGATAGAETEIDLRGVGLLDRKAGVITKLNLGLEERRAPGPATPGLDVTAKLSIACTPIEEVLSEGPLDKSDRAPLTVSYLATIEADRGVWTANTPRGWRVLSSSTNTTTLRLVEADRVTADLLIRTLPEARATAHPTLESFAAEVRGTLDTLGGQVLGVYEGRTPHGLTCYSVHGEGLVRGKPTLWHHYLLKNETDGIAISAVATISDPTKDTATAAPEQAVIDTLQIRGAGKIAGATANNRR